MVYLHKSVFQSHGYLSSANCHVDRRWVLKVSGFALHPFRRDSELQVVECFSANVTAENLNQKKTRPIYLQFRRRTLG